MSKKDLNPSELNEKSDQPESKAKKPRQPKIVQYEGSRWSSLVMLIIVVLTGLALYLTGSR